MDGSLAGTVTTSVLPGRAAVSGGQPDPTFDATSSLRTDEELAADVALGDRAAFTLLYDRYVDTIYALASYMLGRDASEEAVQDVFLRLWQKSFRFDPARGGFRPWLLSVARNHFLDRARRRSLEQRLQLAAGIDMLVGRLVSSDPDIEEQAWKSERARALRAALLDIPEDQRRVLMLAYFGGLTESEIAARLNSPLGTVKKRVRLGMQKLRSRLEQLGLFQDEALRRSGREGL